MGKFRPAFIQTAIFVLGARPDEIKKSCLKSFIPLGEGLPGHSYPRTPNLERGHPINIMIQAQ
jgi:hypothetical protein